MTSHIKTKIINKIIRLFSLTSLLLCVGVSNAAITDLGTAPLVSATTGDVLPNLMYVLDNSGSMGWDYMPDYVNDSNKCKNSSGTFTNSCGYADPPYMTSVFNSIYYDPATTYSPGLNADGSEKTSMTSANTAGWTSVPIDAYGVQSSSNTRLVPNVGLTQGYPDKVWCNTSSPSFAERNTPALGVCKKNGQYTYPTATFNNSATLYGYPFYYTVSAGEYCTNSNMTSCITSTTGDATHTVPAKLRWCTDSGYGTCQAKYLETTPTYKFAKWSGVVSGSSATGSIRINAQSPANSPTTSPTAMSVSDVTVDGISIVTTPTSGLTITDTSSSSQRATLATAIKNAINLFVPTIASGNTDFWATSAGDVVTLFPVDRATSDPISGTLPGGTILITTVPQTSAAGVKATGSITITRAGKTSGAANNVTLNSLKANTGSGNVDILGGSPVTSLTALDSAATRIDLATKIKNQINAFASSPDYKATCAGDAIGNTTTSCTSNVVTITALVEGSASNGSLSANVSSGTNLTYSLSGMGSGSGAPSQTYTIPTTVVSFTGGAPSVNTFNRVDIVPTTTTYSKASTRTDCAGATTCTYDEEMTNFANWYSYYRTRMQMMKTSTSRAFKSIDTRFRVGFISISNQSTYYLPIAQYTAAQKASWYNKLFSVFPNNGTPLRSALTIAGQIYAGKNPVSGFTADPVQYSCQQNFTILTTDGYWNTDSNSDVKNLSGGQIGNMDGTGTSRPMYEGPTATSPTLADATKYYYDTDLRTSALGNCTGSTRANGTTGDVCANNVFVTATDNNIKQHMTTFTLGLGVDASLTYTTDYKTADSGDFFELTQGTRNWPVPVADSQTAVDDLWHAAVNGRGTYFSAKNPNQLSTSLSDALQSIKAKVGAGAAAATSTLNPVSGDNYSYVASYTSVKWIGNLESRTVNVDTGKVSEDAFWCLENVLADTCASPSSIVAETVGSSIQYQCVTPSATAATCPAPGILAGTDCKVEISTSCTGTLQSKVDVSTDTRNIYMNVSGTLGSFSATNLTATGNDTNFSNAFLATNLSQWPSLTTAQKAFADSASLVSFLRGNTGYEDRASNVVAGVDKRIYRFREATLGDLVDSTPIYVGPPKANFSDPGYGTASTLGSFKQIQSTRAGTVYIGANDGMLHAIDAISGQERWAYVPTMVLKNMWKLADTNYGNSIPHSYYVNGDIVANDICTANCTDSTNAVWKTILVGGLNGGGKGYFALDITNPSSPVLLWEFDTSDDGDLGYSYGNPIVTKKADGTWVVLVASGYNNMTGSNPGKGLLYVLNAATGAVTAKYDTGVGDSTTPSGLAKINAYVNDSVVDNSALFVYGGDLLGNVWRFDINTAASSTNPFKFAVLKDPSGVVQPITTRPELAEINGKRVVYVGTGRYLGLNDLTDTQQQTIYAISDETTGSPATLDDPRSSSLMVKQVLVNDTGTATRTIQSPPNVVNFATGRGWYIDFLDSGERQNVPAQLVFGTLLLPTTVPTNTLCSPGGYGWLNFLDYKTGATVSGTIVATKTNAPIVGINVLYVKGKPVVNIVTADNPTPVFPANQPTFTGGSASGFTNHRVIWRELIEEQ